MTLWKLLLRHCRPSRASKLSRCKILALLGSAQPGGEEPSWSKRMKSEVGKDEADGAN
jgi:hypothetical protein